MARWAVAVELVKGGGLSIKKWPGTYSVPGRIFKRLAWFLGPVVHVRAAA
jgi:hypothetical protein